MTVSRGDIVLVAFPFSSGTGSKLRPALVVQNDRNNQRLKNTIVVAITSTTHRASQPTQLLIEAATPEGRQPGLLFDSVVACENIATVEQRPNSAKDRHLWAGTYCSEFMRVFRHR